MTKCTADTQEDTFIVEYYSCQEDQPLIRCSSYHHIINIGTPASVEEELIELAESATEWGIDRTGGNLYVVDMADASKRMKFQNKAGVSDNVVMQVKTAGFVVDDRGHVICTNCAGNDKVTKFHKTLLS